MKKYEYFDDLFANDEKFGSNSQNDAAIFAAVDAFNTKIGQTKPVEPMRGISSLLIGHQETIRPVERSPFFLNIVSKFLF